MELKKSKGFLYSLDAALATFIFIFIIIGTEFMLQEIQSDSFSKLQLSRIGKDTLTILDKEGALQTFNKSAIENRLSALLPKGTKAHIKVETYVYANGTFFFIGENKYGEEAPQYRALHGVRRIFVNINENHVTNYSIASAYVWLE